MTGENVFADNATGYIDQCLKPTVDRQIPFAWTGGNVSRRFRFSRSVVSDHIDLIIFLLVFC